MRPIHVKYTEIGDTILISKKDFKKIFNLLKRQNVDVVLNVKKKDK